jgi:hypothetical protein
MGVAVEVATVRRARRPSRNKACGGSLLWNYVAHFPVGGPLRVEGGPTLELCH